MIDVVKKASSENSCSNNIPTLPIFKTGMVGETSDNRIFVIVGDKLFYQDGEIGKFNSVKDIEADYSNIKRIVTDCISFSTYKCGTGTVIYEAPKKMTKEQIEKELGYSIEIVDSNSGNTDKIDKLVASIRKGEWISMTDDDGCTWFECSRCEYDLDSLEETGHFCPNCGAPMTDEAVQIVMERLGVLYDC